MFANNESNTKTEEFSSKAIDHFDQASYFETKWENFSKTHLAINLILTTTVFVASILEIKTSQK